MINKNNYCLRYRFLRPTVLFIKFVVSFFLFINTSHAVTQDFGSLESSIEFLEDHPSSVQLRGDPKAALFRMAEIRFKQGLWDEAAQYAKTVLSKEQNHSGAHGIMGAIQALGGNVEIAKNELLFLDKIKDSSYYADFIRAIILTQEGKYGQADNNITAALEKEISNPVVLYYDGSLNLARQRPQQAIKSFKAALAVEADFTPALAGLGQAYFQQNDLKTAAEYYSKAVANAPEILLYRKQLIDIYKSLGRQEAANREIKNALYFTPGIKQSYLKQGMQLLTAGTYPEAIKRMDEAIKIYKYIPEAHYIKAAALINLKEEETALSNLKTFISQRWAMPQAHHYAGMCYLALGRIDEAESQFKNVIAITPEAGKSFVPLIIIEQLRQNYDRALDGLRLARLGGEPVALVHFLSAHVLLAKDNQTEALQNLKEAAGLIPGLSPNLGPVVPQKDQTINFASNRNLMVIYFYNGWYDKSIEYSDALIKQNRDDLFAWYYRALSKTAQQKLDDAINAYNELLRIDPNLTAAHMGSGKIYLQTGDYKKAKNAFNKTIEIDDRNAGACDALGDIFAATQKEKEAIQSYKKALSIDPGMIDPSLKIAMIYSEKPEKLEEALEFAIKGKVLDPDNPISLDVLGWVYICRGEADMGIPLLEKASEQLPRDPMIHYHLGVGYYNANNLEAAKRSLQIAVQSSQQFKGKKHAREILNKLPP